MWKYRLRWSQKALVTSAPSLFSMDSAEIPSSFFGGVRRTKAPTQRIL
jgi:hypothetical protein